ncbi:zinc finger protein 654-like [Cololabis saira]|uniref:zinc finger protein 654-like n=1 Tax=Cololabis saira TaxID=129043 RepID=UPI002AD46C5D|nr:zinc finger protein 654-like [Cololabis saira]
MADNESDLETDGLESALDSLCLKYCSDESFLSSKDYCSKFCELVEEYTGQWHVPLPQLKVLRAAFCNFTKATAGFPDDCQHIQYVLSSLALSFFELMLFFSKEEFLEEPLKDILDTFQGCHSQLLRHRNIYLQHVKQVIKGGGPWENPVLQGVLKETDLPPNDVEDYLSSELPIFLELRVRYLQACERIQEAMALSKSCLENPEAGKHLYFHQAYLTCLYKASLYENLNKEMADIDGRDAVEIICNTESVEKDELLLSLCRAFLTRLLHNGDMYYIWDLVFIWSRLYLRAHPSRQGFLAECLQLASSATNVRAIFPFVKLVTTEVGAEGVQVCVELCARALQLCDMQSDTVTQSLVCKTIAFLLPHDLEICRACALLVFCQERSLEAYRTVCLLYMHPDEEPHPHNSLVRTSVRFHILQMLKERLRFDPEFWNLLTLRTYCLGLMSDKVMKAAVLSEMKEEEEKEGNDLFLNNCKNESCTFGFNSCHCAQAAFVDQPLPEEQTPDEAGRSTAPDKAPLKRRKWMKRLRKRTQLISDDEFELPDDPEFKYNLKTASLGKKPVYSLRHNHRNMENSASVKNPVNRKREYLSRCVKSQILKRKGRKKRWLQGLPKLEVVQTVKEKIIKVKGKKRGRKPLPKLELSYPDNEIYLTEESPRDEQKMDSKHKEQDMPRVDGDFENKSELEHENDPEQENGQHANLDLTTNSSKETQDEAPTQFESAPCENQPCEAQVPAVKASPEFDGPLLDLLDCPIELLHNYSLKSKRLDCEKPELLETPETDEVNGDAEREPQPREEVEVEVPKTKVKAKRTWKDRLQRSQQYSHLTHHCSFCHKDYKGLNVMRHALSHLKSRKLRCILCGKHFKQLPLAKKHVLEHIDEMRKVKPPDKEKTPVANGTMDKIEAQHQDENQTPVLENETIEQKPKGKTKVSSLTREERIIRNVRTLIKKTSVLHKKSKNTNASKETYFKDEQVVISDGLVIVRDANLLVAEGEGREKPAGENGCSVDITYPLCPSESCDRVFLRISSTLTRHALKCHINEDSVLEKTFVWSKRKCSFCIRPIQFLQQYKDHMKLHDTQEPYFCYHLECKQRFSTQQELKDHVNTHQPFRPQCSFQDCEKLFSTFQGLYDHEWRHYIPAPQKEELELGPGKETVPSAEAPWKQRVKIEETWLQNKKGQRDSPTPDGSSDRVKTEGESCGETVPDLSQNPSKSDSCPAKVGVHEHMEDIKPSINGYEDFAKKETEELKFSSHTATPSKKCQKKTPNEWDLINVKDHDDVSTLVEGIQKNVEEPHITEHKTFKPEDPAYAPFVKAPFIRPPPSTYLDESVLSMRKRRLADEPPPKKYSANYKKKKEPEVEKGQKDTLISPEQKIRHRCDKCLSSFSSLEELKKHRALNTCSALFGFDSDDES